MNREIETLKIENLKLKQENKMLRELLLEHNIPVAINAENVTRTLSSKEKLEIYISYFKCRTDVYAKRFYKENNDYISIPRGFYSELIDSLKVINADFLVLDKRINLESIDVKFRSEQSSIQSQSVNF